MRFRRPVACVALGLVAGCQWDGRISGTGIVVHIADFDVNPLSAECGTTFTSPPKNIASPDSVMTQVRMVNTTDSDAVVVSAGTYGTIVISSDSDDLGKSVAVTPSVPFTPSPALLAARIGDLSIRVPLPMDPVCQSKPIGYRGSIEMLVVVRMTTQTGQYTTPPVRMSVTWR
ncbi:MAG TPA: hypothetical protein VJR92_02455 [Gemmatimonadaceae bacterium]|nr:hypothetical protein [Gemmatimonadaceae bacterium]